MSSTHSDGSKLVTNEFQPYQSWLSLPAEIGKPNFYQLLSIDPAEQDKEKISAAAARATTKVRSQKPGEHARLWMSVLDELKQAKECLLDESKRKAYDQQLASAGNSQPKTDKSKPAKKSEVQASPFAALYPPGMGANSPAPTATPSSTPPARSSAATSSPFATTSPAPLSPTRATPITAGPPPISLASPTPASAIPDDLAPRVAMPPIPNAMPTTPLMPPTQSASADSHTTAPPMPANGAAPNPAPLTPVAAAPTPVVASPMAPVFDPTLHWNDADQVPIETPSMPVGAMSAVAAQTAVPASQIPASTELPPEQAVEMARQRYEAIRRHSRNNMLKVAAFFLVLLVAAGGVIYAFKDKILGGDSDAIAQIDQQQDNTDKDSAPEKQDDAADLNSKTNDSEKQSDDQADDKKDQSSTNAEDDPDDEKMDKSDEEMKPDTDPETDPPTDPDKPDPKGTPTTPETTPTTTPDPTPPAGNPEDEKAAMRAQYAKLGTALTSAKQALYDRKLDEANKLIADAEELATTLEHKDMVARLKAVAEQIGIFWQTVSDECAKLQAMDEIQMSTTILAVVEANSEMLIYRYNGENKRQAVIELPAGLAMKIAERAWPDETVESRITRGAVYAIDAIGNPDNAERAREIWEEAELGGGMVRPLLTFLADDYDLVAELIEQVDIPEQADLDTAADEFKETYRKDMARTTATARTELAQKLIADAPGSATPALRYILYEQAADQAARGGDFPLAMQAIDEQAKWFKLDLMDTKLNLLESAVKYRLTPEASKELTRTVFELADAATKAKNLESADKLAKIGVAAALKSKDVELRARAVELSLEIEDLIKKSKTN